MILRVLLMTCLLLMVESISVAQDFIRWGLPDGAKARIGKGTITGDIAYSSDGARLAVASSIGIWLYDTQTHQAVALFTGHMSGIGRIAFSPDERTLAGGGGGEIRLWDAVTGQHRHTLTGNSVAFSPDGRIIASGGGRQDNTVRLWDAVTGEHKRTLTGHRDVVTSVAFSPDGRTLASAASADWDQTIHLWDIVTGETKHILTAGAGEVGSVAFSPDGRTLASGYEDGTVHLWDAVTGEHKQILDGRTFLYIDIVVFSPDGRTLASAGWGQTIHLWDAITGELK